MRIGLLAIAFGTVVLALHAAEVRTQDAGGSGGGDAKDEPIRLKLRFFTEKSLRTRVEGVFGSDKANSIFNHISGTFVKSLQKLTRPVELASQQEKVWDEDETPIAELLEDGNWLNLVLIDGDEDAESEFFSSNEAPGNTVVQAAGTIQKLKFSNTGEASVDISIIEAIGQKIAQKIGEKLKPVPVIEMSVRVFVEQKLKVKLGKQRNLPAAQGIVVKAISKDLSTLNPKISLKATEGITAFRWPKKKTKKGGKNKKETQGRSVRDKVERRLRKKFKSSEIDTDLILVLVDQKSYLSHVRDILGNDDKLTCANKDDISARTVVMTVEIDNDDILSQLRSSARTAVKNNIAGKLGIESTIKYARGREDEYDDAYDSEGNKCEGIMEGYGHGDGFSKCSDEHLAKYLGSQEGGCLKEKQVSRPAGGDAKDEPTEQEIRLFVEKGLASKILSTWSRGLTELNNILREVAGAFKKSLKTMKPRVKLVSKKHIQMLSKTALKDQLQEGDWLNVVLIKDVDDAVNKFFKITKAPKNTVVQPMGAMQKIENGDKSKDESGIEAIGKSIAQKIALKLPKPTKAPITVIG